MGETNHSESRFSLRPNLRDVSHWLSVKPRESLVSKIQTSACKCTSSVSFQNILLRTNFLNEYFKVDKVEKENIFVLAHLFWREAFTIYFHKTLDFSLGSLVTHCSVLNIVLYVPGYGNFWRQSSTKQLYSSNSFSTDASCATQAWVCLV